jgi:hypothetical protein
MYNDKITWKIKCQKIKQKNNYTKGSKKNKGEKTKIIRGKIKKFNWRVKLN